MTATFRGPCPDPLLRTAFVDGELGHDGRDEVLSHLATCPRCRTAVDAERRTKSALAGLGAHAPSAELLARLHAHADRTDGQVVPFEPAVARSPRRRAASTLAAVASVAVFFVGGASFVGAFVEGAPQEPRREAGVTTVVPATDLFVAEHAASVGGGVGDPARTTVPARLPGLVPVGPRVP